MKINSINKFEYTKQRYFRGHGTPDIQGQNPQKEESKVNPLYYQALYAIKPLMPVVIAGKYNNNNDDFYIEVERDFTKEFLTDKNGNTDKERVDKFIEIYQKIANELNKLRHERLDIYQAEKDEESPVFEDKEEQHDLIDSLISCQELEIVNIPFDAYEKAKRYFQLSKTPDGIDISDYDKKMKLIGDIEMYTLNIFEPHNEDTVYEQITNNAKDSQGNLDYDLINDLFEALDGQDFSISAKKVINVLKTLYSKDENSKKEILDTIKKMNSSYFDINSDGDCFIQVMNLCFDNNSRFRPEKASFVVKCCEYLATFVDSALANVHLDQFGIDGYPVADDDEEGAQYNSYDYIVNTAHKILISYFDEITDSEGELHKDELTIEEYIRTII